MSKCIGILTSGGDCAGLNAVIRAVAHRAISGHGWKVIGIHEGIRGLMSRPPRYEVLTLDVFTGNILRLAGTIPLRRRISETVERCGNANRG